MPRQNALSRALQLLGEWDTGFAVQVFCPLEWCPGPELAVVGSRGWHFCWLQLVGVTRVDRDFHLRNYGNLQTTKQDKGHWAALWVQGLWWARLSSGKTRQKRRPLFLPGTKHRPSAFGSSIKLQKVKYPNIWLPFPWAFSSVHASIGLGMSSTVNKGLNLLTSSNKANSFWQSECSTF